MRLRRPRDKDAEAPGWLNRDAIDLLVARKTRLLAFLERRVGNRADAEDLLQAAMLRLVEKGGLLRDKDKLVPWFYRLLQNMIVDWYRRRSSAHEIQARLYASARREPDIDQALFAEVCACVLDVLDTLSPQYADIVRRVDLDERPLGTVAHELGISMGNVSVRLHRARRALLKGLRGVCGACVELHRYWISSMVARERCSSDSGSMVEIDPIAGP